MPVVERIAAELDVRGLRRHVQAGRGGGRGRGRRGDGQRRLRPARPGLAAVCARTGAALVVMHTRVRAQGHAARPGRLRRRRARRARRSSPSAWPPRSRPGWGRSRSCSIPGPTSPRRRPRPSPCCAASTSCTRSGRPLLLAVSRKDFLGAITGRGPRERGAATLAAVGWAADAGAHLVRVHDVAAAADYLAVRAVLRGERVLAPGRGADARPLPGRRRRRLPSAGAWR